MDARVGDRMSIGAKMKGRRRQGDGGTAFSVEVYRRLPGCGIVAYTKFVGHLHDCLARGGF